MDSSEDPSKKRSASPEVEEQEPCRKRPKLSKKELLEQAKARLREAQKKKESLLKNLEEEKTKEAEVAQPDEYYEEYDYDYYYTYHIPPVTGSKDSLLITNVASTGPPEKVRFEEEKQACIEELLKTLTNRRRTLSPVNPAPTGNWNPPHHNNNVDNNGNGQHLPPQKNQENKDGNISIASSSSNQSHQNQLKNRNIRHQINNDQRNLADNNNHRNQPNNNKDVHRDNSDHRNPSNFNMDVHRAINEKPRDMRPHHPGNAPKGPGPQQGPMNYHPPPPPLEKRHHPQHLPPPLPQRPPPPRPWKRALVQVTGKTLDCDSDLPSNASYIVRTQDRSVMARIHFFCAPANNALLEHHPPKSAIQDHFLSVSRLPCNTSHAWKGADILQFLKNQDQRRTTYLPPARRNLPLSHWALLDFEEPLHQAPSSLGYFTASPHTINNIINNPKRKNSNEICFAGKLVWNLLDEGGPFANHGPPAPDCIKLCKWGEIISAVAVTSARNGAMVVTVQGLYETDTVVDPAAIMPHSLRGRKVILPKSRTVGILVGGGGAVLPPNHKKGNNSSNNMDMGICQVLFPNGMASGPSSVQSLLGARAILYD
jgi:hypothetical protein